MRTRTLCGSGLAREGTGSVNINICWADIFASKSNRRTAAPTGKQPALHYAFTFAFDLAFDLRRPVKPRWPQSGIAQWAPRQDAGVAATRPWMADRGGLTEQCLTAGMPSLGEAPSGGARALCLLWRSSKVSRRKGGTLSGHNRSNGYVHIPRKGYRWPPRTSQLPQGIFAECRALCHTAHQIRELCRDTKL